MNGHGCGLFRTITGSDHGICARTTVTQVGRDRETGGKSLQSEAVPSFRTPRPVLFVLRGVDCICFFQNVGQLLPYVRLLTEHAKAYHKALAGWCLTMKSCYHVSLVCIEFTYFSRLHESCGKLLGGFYSDWRARGFVSHVHSFYWFV